MRDLAGRLNWKHAAVIITLATTLPPYTTLLYGFGGHSHQVSIAVYALFWAIYPPESAFSGLQVMTDSAMAASGVFVYIGPIPVQLVTGLLLMYLAGPKEPVAPW
jgi:hypothetical protein